MFVRICLFLAGILSCTVCGCRWGTEETNPADSQPTCTGFTCFCEGIFLNKMLQLPESSVTCTYSHVASCGNNTYSSNTRDPVS